MRARPRYPAIWPTTARRSLKSGDDLLQERKKIKNKKGEMPWKLELKKKKKDKASCPSSHCRNQLLFFYFLFFSFFYLPLTANVLSFFFFLTLPSLSLVPHHHHFFFCTCIQPLAFFPSNMPPSKRTSLQAQSSASKDQVCASCSASFLFFMSPFVYFHSHSFKAANKVSFSRSPSRFSKSSSFSLNRSIRY